MSQDNVDVAKRFEELMVPALDESDAQASEQRLEEIKAILDPDVVFYASPTIPHGGTYRGYDAFFKMGEQFRDLWFRSGRRFGVYAAVLSVLAGNWRPSLGVRLRIRLFFLLVALQRVMPIVPRTSE